MPILYYFSKLDPSEIHLIGLTKEAIKTALKGRGHEDILRALTDDEYLFQLKRRVYEAKISEETKKKILDFKVPLSRIDAIFARF